SGNKRIDAYSATGVFEGAFGWGVRDSSAALQLCTLICRGGVGSGFNAGQIGQTNFGGLTVASGLVYFADAGGRRIDVFQPTISGGATPGIAFNRAFGWDVVASGPDNTGSAFEVCNTAANPTDVCKQGLSGTGLGEFSPPGNVPAPRDVAVDSAGNVYALDASASLNNFGNNRIQKFDSSSTPITATFGSSALSTAFGTGHVGAGISIDSDDHLYVSGNRSGSSNQLAVAELDPSGSLVDVHGSDLTVSSLNQGIAITPASLGGNLYITTGVTGTLNGAWVLSDAQPTIDPVTNVTGTTATFNGSVASKTFNTDYHFEYSTDGANWTPFPVPHANAGTDPGSIPVSQGVSHLVGSEDYHVRLVQNRPTAGGAATSPETTFSTDPAAPEISNAHFADLSESGVTLNADVNP